MRKLVTAVLAVVLIATAGYFGARAWARQRAVREVETGLAWVRASGGNVSHGAVEIELLRREVKLSDIVAETAGGGGTVLRIGRVVASGVGDAGAGRLSAARLEVEDLMFDGTLPLAAGLHVSWKIPRLVFEGYSGPTVPPSPDAAASPVETIRAVLQEFAAVTADRLMIPAMTVSVTLPGPPPYSAQYGYSGIELRGIAEGRVAAAMVARAVTAVDAPMAGGAGGFTTEVDGMEMLDGDVAPVLAVLAGSADDQYRRLYRQITSGAYTMTSADPRAPVRMTITEIAAADAALKPAKLPLERIIAVFGALPRAGEAADPQRELAALDTAATIYEGIRFGGVEMRGMKVTVSGHEDFRIGAVRMTGFENGRLADLSVTDLDGQTWQNQPVRIGRFALRGLGVSELMRSMARLGTGGRDPSPDQMMALLHCLEGVEFANLTAPTAFKPIVIDSARISWGEFAGAVPTRVEAALRITGPVRREDGEFSRGLADAGMMTATIDAAAALRWREAGGVLVLQPVTVDVAGVGALELKAALAGVPRSALTLDATTSLMAMAAAEAGPVEFTVTDRGGVDLAVADVARTRNLSPDEARRTMTEDAIQPAAALVPLAPDLSGLADAVAQFLEAPGGRLTVTVTPKGHVRLLPLVAIARDSPAAGLGQFRIEARVTR